MGVSALHLVFRQDCMVDNDHKRPCITKKKSNDGGKQQQQQQNKLKEASQGNNKFLTYAILCSQSQKEYTSIYILLVLLWLNLKL